VCVRACVRVGVKPDSVYNKEQKKKKVSNLIVFITRNKRRKKHENVS
jgi:hypothetical protein